MTDIIKQALKIMEDAAQIKGAHLKSSQLSKDYCRLQIGDEPEEVFALLLLDNNHRLLSFEKLSRGTVNEASVYFRPIVRLVMAHNAAKVILTHNHPSGETTPSEADKCVTERLAKFLKEIDCQVVDHIIVSQTATTSFAEKGML